MGDLAGAYSRRINIQHRLVYQVLRDQRMVKVIRMRTHGHEALPKIVTIGSSLMHVSVIIPAAGLGTRMGREKSGVSRKQFMLLNARRS